MKKSVFKQMMAEENNLREHRDMFFFCLSFRPNGSEWSESPDTLDYARYDRKWCSERKLSITKSI